LLFLPPAASQETCSGPPTRAQAFNRADQPANQNPRMRIFVHVQDAAAKLPTSRRVRSASRPRRHQSERHLPSSQWRAERRDIATQWQAAI